MIRRYELADIDKMMALVEKDLKTTIYGKMHFNRDKLGDTLRGNVNNTQVFGDVADEGGVIIGGMIATIGSPMFTKEVIAYDHFLYIEPSRRSLKLATELVGNYVAWAKERRVHRAMLGNSLGRDIDNFARLAKRLGFEQVGTIHSMEI